MASTGDRPYVIENHFHVAAYLNVGSAYVSARPGGGTDSQILPSGMGAAHSYPASHPAPQTYVYGAPLPNYAQIHPGFPWSPAVPQAFAVPTTQGQASVQQQTGISTPAYADYLYSYNRAMESLRQPMGPGIQQPYQMGHTGVGFPYGGGGYLYSASNIHQQPPTVTQAISSSVSQSPNNTRQDMEAVEDYIAECEQMTQGMSTPDKIAWYRRRLEIRRTGHRRDAILRRIDELITNENRTSMMSATARLIRPRSDSISSTSSTDSDSSIETIPRFQPEVTSNYISSSTSSVPARRFTILPRPFAIYEGNQSISVQSQSNQSFQGVYLTTPDLPSYITPVPYVHTISSNSSPASQDRSNRAYSGAYAVPSRWDAPTPSPTTTPPVASYVPLDALPSTPTHTPGVTNTNPALLAALIPPTPTHIPGLRNISPVVPATWIPPAPPPMPVERTPEIIIFGPSTPSQPTASVEQANPTTTPVTWGGNNPVTSTNPVMEQRHPREMHWNFGIGANNFENIPVTPARPSSGTGWNSRTSPPQFGRTWTVPSSPEAVADDGRRNRPASPAPQANRGSSNVAAPPANELADSRLNDATMPEMVELPNRRRNFCGSPVANVRDNARVSSNEVGSGWDSTIPPPAAGNTGPGWDWNDVTLAPMQEQSSATTEGRGNVTLPADEGLDWSHPPSDDESGDEWHNARASGDEGDFIPTAEDKPGFDWSDPSTWART